MPAAPASSSEEVSGDGSTPRLRSGAGSGRDAERPPAATLCFGAGSPRTTGTAWQPDSLYDHPDYTGVAGHQIFVTHLLRDLADAAEAYHSEHPRP